MADVDLCAIPLADLTQEQRTMAMAQRDARDAAIYEENKHFVRERRPPIIISDSLGDVKNPVDGKMYDSKSSYHKKIREAGCHVYEGPVNRQKADHNVAPELKQALQQVLSNKPKGRR